MTNPKLHLDMDSSRRGLYKALLDFGFDVTRTPNKDVHEDASDELQLLWAISHQRILFTFNIKDFVTLAKNYPYHAGILLAHQNTVSIDQLINAIRKMMQKTTEEDWAGQIRWISDWMK